MRILAFGDSFVAGAGDPDHLGWIGRALAGRSDVTLYNLGVRGETSRDVSLRWADEAAPRLRTSEAVRLVFSFGCNDCTLEDGRRRVEAFATLKAAQAIVVGARGLAPVLLVGPPPIADAGVLRASVVETNAALQSLAARMQVPFIDVHDRLLGHGAWLREAAAGDGAHPSAGGYAAMARMVVEHPAWRSFVGLK